MSPTMNQNLTTAWLDELEIRSLIVRERYYRDTNQWSKLRAAYHPDASKTQVKISWFNGDIDGFVAGSENMTKGGAAAMHTICPIEIKVNKAKAVSESTGSIMIRFEHEGMEFDCTSYTRFVSRFERVDAEWKLLTLEAIYDKDSISPVHPCGSQTGFHLSENARASYRCISWVLAQKGFTIDPNLPGSDLPGSGEALLESNRAWLGDDASERVQ